MATDERINEIYREIYDYFERKDKEGCDERIRSLDVESLDANELVSYLTVTLSASSELPHREEFFNKAKVSLIERGEYEEGLLNGLEGTLEQESRCRQAIKLINYATSLRKD